MSSQNLSRLDGNARWQATVIATNKYMLMRQVLQLLRCMCGSNNVESTSKCSCRCSCKRNSLVSTELCNCAEDDKCQNTEPMVIALDTKEGSFYIAQYPVRWTAQSASHFLPSLTDLFIPTPFSASPGSILARQQLRAKTKSLTFPPLSIARYSFIQLSEQGRL